MQNTADGAGQVAFTCDGKALVAAGSDQALRMWDLESGRVRHTLTGHSQKVMHAPGLLLGPTRACCPRLHGCAWPCAAGGMLFWLSVADLDAYAGNLDRPDRNYGIICPKICYMKLACCAGVQRGLQPYRLAQGRVRRHGPLDQGETPQLCLLRCTS